MFPVSVSYGHSMLSISDYNRLYKMMDIIHFLTLSRNEAQISKIWTLPSLSIWSWSLRSSDQGMEPQQRSSTNTHAQPIESHSQMPRHVPLFLWHQITTNQTYKKNVHLNSVIRIPNMTESIFEKTFFDVYFDLFVVLVWSMSHPPSERGRVYVLLCSQPTGGNWDTYG